MPREVKYYVDAKGVPRSAASGAVLKQGVADTARATYRQVEPPLAQLKAKRQERAATSQRVYLANYDEYAPEAINELTRTNIRFGHNKDSLLNALNRAYATSMDIPLNAQNRVILNSIYADEMSSAMAARNADFAKFQSRFAAGKGKKGKVPKL